MMLNNFGQDPAFALAFLFKMHGRRCGLYLRYRSVGVPSRRCHALVLDSVPTVSVALPDVTMFNNGLQTFWAQMQNTFASNTSPWRGRLTAGRGLTQLI
eukprot:444856-Amphidinium_carterae.1